jgi:crotonobetainyl-CoA:carnitine CoA-transferase CaiB-like acyl-CoA transferase
MATMILADFGAEVIKVEPPAGDRLREHPGYLTWNRSKLRVTLDPGTFEGLGAARALIATAAAAVFDARPGELERLGLDATTVLAANPGLLHVWMPPYGTAGRWSQLPPDDLLLAGLSGVACLQLSYEDRPVALATPQVSYGHAAIAANGIAAGLWERGHSGKGQALVVSGLHGVSSVEMGGAITNGMAIRVARSSRGGAHYGLYPAGDGNWFFLGCLTQGFFVKALNALGLTEIMTWEGVDGELTNIMRTPELAERVRTRLQEHFASHPRDHWLRVLREADVPNGPAGLREEWFRDETVAVNEMRLVLEHPEHGPVEMPGISVKMADTPGAVKGFAMDVAVAELLDGRKPALPQPADTPKRPLEGVRVLDLGAFIAGTYAPTVLANYGADVIKVEPLDGDPFRTYGLTSYGHNLGKRSIALDLKSPDGRAVFEEMVRRSDVVLDNYRLGVRERLRADYATLRAINPRIITCSVTGYGPVGPLARDPGFDPLLQARSGMMMAQGGNVEPVFHQIAVNDSGTAMMAAFGIQAALHAREKTGRGQEVLTSLANQTVLFQSGELTRYAGCPELPVGGVDFLGPTALRRYYASADGWVAIACSAPQHFHALAVALAHPEWAGRTIAERALSEPADGALAQGIAEALAAMPRMEALDRLLARGVPCAPVTRVEEIFTDSWLAENGFLQELDDPTWGRMLAPRTYADWSRSTGGFIRRAPGLGEHTVEVLAGLGLSEEHIAGLIGRGVVRAG